VTLPFLTVSSHIQLDVNWWLLLGLVIAALTDTYLRWAAFGRIESVAIDIALYTMLYSLSEAFVSKHHTDQWYIKSLIEGGILLSLSLLHALVYRAGLQRQVRAYYEQLIDDSPEQLRPALRALQHLMEKMMPLSVELYVLIRTGKRKRREDAARLTQEILALTQFLPPNARRRAVPKVSEEIFLLSRGARLGMALVLATGAIVCLLAPVITKT